MPAQRECIVSSRASALELTFRIGFIFIRDYAPRYLVSFYVTLGLACFGILVTVAKVSIMYGCSHTSDSIANHMLRPMLCIVSIRKERF